MPHDGLFVIVALLAAIWLGQTVFSFMQKVRSDWTRLRNAPHPGIAQSDSLVRRGETTAAFAALDEVIRTGSSGDAAHAHACRASILLNAGADDAAARDLDDALRLGPRHPYVLEFARSLRGLLKARTGDTEQALATCEGAVRLSPQSSDAYGSGNPLSRLAAGLFAVAAALYLANSVVG